MRITFKQRDKEKGLMAVGAGPRPYNIKRGGEVIGSIIPIGGDWRGPLKGWYFVLSGSAVYPGSPLVNTYPKKWKDVDSAKLAVRAEIAKQLTKKPNP